MKMKKRLCLLLVFTLLLTLSFVGCGKSEVSQEDKTEAKSEAKADTKTEKKEEKKAEKKEQLELVLAPPAMVSPFYAAVINGAKPMADELGYKLTVLSPERGDDIAGQVKIVEDMVQRNVAGIAICAHDDKAIVSAVKKANEAGIPIVIFNSLTELPGGEVYAYTGYEQSAGGAKVAEWVNKVTDGEAKVAILEGLPGFHTTERKGGFVEKAKEYPGIEIVASQAADWEREKGMNVATNMLQSNPDIEVFYGLCDEMVLGAAQALKTMGIDGVKTVGIDGNPNALDAVKKGELSGTLYVNPEIIGSNSIKLLDQAINGEESPENDRMVVETIVVDDTIVDEYIK